MPSLLTLTIPNQPGAAPLIPLPSPLPRSQLLPASLPFPACLCSCALSWVWLLRTSTGSLFLTQFSPPSPPRTSALSPPGLVPFLAALNAPSISFSSEVPHCFVNACPLSCIFHQNPKAEEKTSFICPVKSYALKTIGSGCVFVVELVKLVCIMDKMLWNYEWDFFFALLSCYS